MAATTRAEDAPEWHARVPVLIVDDNAGKRTALKSVLAPLGYAIVETDSGIGALRCLMTQEFAVILLDVRMPDMDGFETAALIRQRRQSEMTPIIFITAHGQHDVQDTDRYAEGAVDFMFAPVQPHELRAKVSVFANLFIRAGMLAEQAREVQASADQLRLLTDAAPVGIFQTDGDNRYVYTNPRWSVITGVPAELATGRTWEAIIGPERVLAMADAAAADPGALGHRFTIELPGLGPRILLVTSRSIPDSDGGVAGWVGTLADVTAEAGAEAAMSSARDAATEASRLKSDFLANMSHEIRTPMNGVLGMTDLLLETELDARQRDYALTVRNSGMALLTIINDILDFSKVEAGKLDLEEIEFSPRAVVDGVVDLLAGPAQAKGLDLVAAVDSSVPAIVRGDPGRLRQILTNLIGNANKFTQAGEIVVRARLAELAGDDAVLHFEVCDTGDGIANHDLAMIFQPFVQADASSSRMYGGTGLGLAISGQLVALMGGSCSVTSRLGEGSSFSFTVCVQCEANQPEDALFALDADLARMGAVIVEDNATLRGVLVDYLTGWGMRVSAFGAAPAALAALRSSSGAAGCAVAIVGRQIPEMDGLELMDAIVADPSLDLGLVLTTNLGQQDELGDRARFSRCASLTKPIHPAQLRTCLRGVVLGLEDARTDGAEPVAPQPSSNGGSAVRLLLAEDNLINQQVAIAMLASGGYHVDTVPDGAAAVRAVADHRYDAILMDCQMPKLSGYEATAAIRARERSGQHIPIIAMTAGARTEDRERCLTAGMDSYLSKPVSKEALLATVAHAVGASAPGRERAPGAAGPQANTRA